MRVAIAREPVQLASGRLDMIVVNRYGSSALRGEDVLGKFETFLIGGPAGCPDE